MRPPIGTAVFGAAVPVVAFIGLVGLVGSACSNGGDDSVIASGTAETSGTIAPVVTSATTAPPSSETTASGDSTSSVTVTTLARPTTASTGGSASTTSQTTSPTTATTQTTSPTTATTAPTSTTEQGPGGQSNPAAWVGAYRWEETAAGGPGSNQTLVHDLVLVASPVGDPDDDDDDAQVVVTGTLTQNGFQTATEITVRATPVDGGLAIGVVDVVSGLTSLKPGDVAFTLSGDPAAPVTTIGALLPLIVEQPQTGSYFLPV